MSSNPTDNAHALSHADRTSIDERVTDRLPGDIEMTEAERVERQRNVATVGRFLELLEAEQIEAFLDLWADDTRQDMPYAPPDFPGTLHGKARIAEQYRALPATYDYMRYSDRELFATHDPRVVIARFRGDIKLKGKDVKYDNRYLNVFVFDADGRIVRNIEHFNPLVLMAGGAFGDGGHPTGGKGETENGR